MLPADALRPNFNPNGNIIIGSRTSQDKAQLHLTQLASDLSKMSNIEMNAIYFDTKILIAFYHWNTIQVIGYIHMKRPIYLI